MRRSTRQSSEMKDEPDHHEGAIITQIGDRSVIHYLDRSHLEDFADVRLIASDGQCFYVNRLLLVSQSRLLLKIFKSFGDNGDDATSISTDLDSNQLLVLSNFIMEGILPPGPIDYFQHFGIVPSGQLEMIDFDSIKKEEPESDNDDAKSNSSSLYVPEGMFTAAAADEEEEANDTKLMHLRSRVVLAKLEDVPSQNLEFKEFTFTNGKRLKKRKYTKRKAAPVNIEPNRLQRYHKDFENYIRIQEKAHITRSYQLPKPLEEYVKLPDKLPDPQLEVLDEQDTLVYDAKGQSQFKCWFCHQLFPSIKSRSKHRVRHHEVAVICPLCNKAYMKDRSTTFKKHMYLHEKGRETFHECIACGHRAKDVTTLKAHCQRMGKYHDNQCAHCHERVWSYDAYKEHIKEEHDDMWLYTCGLCTETFDTEDRRFIHRRSEHVDRPKAIGSTMKEQKNIPVVCESCGKTFPNADCLTSHIVRRHREKNIPCKLCDFKCASKNVMVEHVRGIHEILPCAVCGELVKRKNRKRHILRKHTGNTDMPFVCKVCNKGFSERNNYNEHLNVHTGAKPHICKYCGRGYASTGNKRMHERTTHEGYKRPGK